MERLYFVCPETGERVDPGIESELDTLLQIRTQEVTAQCPHCGRAHTWVVGDAQLTRVPVKRAEDSSDITNSQRHDYGH